MKSRQCPNCLSVLGSDTDYHFDDKLNLICSKCNKVVFPTDSSKEATITKRDQYQYNEWQREKNKKDKRIPVQKRDQTIVYGLSSPGRTSIGFLPEHVLIKEPNDKLFNINKNLMD